MNRRIARLIVVAALAGCLLSGPPALADGGFLAASCPVQTFPVPPVLYERPVVYVHGWTAAATDGDAGGITNLLEAKLGDGYGVLPFDYGWANAEWAADAKIRTCLADYIHRASLSFQSGGGDGRVLGAAHSMGGIGLRAAASVLVREGEGGSLAGIVTLGAWVSNQGAGF